jgi:hypothetical protein
MSVEKNDDDDVGNEIIIETEESGESQTSPQQASGDDDDELSSYSTKVQARIGRITEKYRKEQRDREEATRIAQKLLEENNQLKSRVQALDTGYLTEYGARLEHQEYLVKGAYRVAYESGDADAMMSAQEDLAKIVLEKQRYATAKQRSEAAPARAQQAEREAPAPQQQAAPQVKPDPKAQGWAEKNKWFGEDRIMTTAAIAIHQTLVEDEGFDPSSNEYYTEIDRRLRTEFPHKFAARKPGGGSQVAPAGNSASRSTTQERRTVRLSPSQVAIAKRLNVPLEEYAKYVKD